jgi:hypothetical protein
MAWMRATSSFRWNGRIFHQGEDLASKGSGIASSPTSAVCLRSDSLDDDDTVWPLSWYCSPVTSPKFSPKHGSYFGQRAILAPPWAQ